MARQQHRLEEGEQPARVGLRMSAELKRELSRLAFEQGRSENAVMVEALREYVDKQSAARSCDQAAP